MRHASIFKNSIVKHVLRIGAIFGLFFGIISAQAPAQTSANEATTSGAVPVHMVVTVKPHHGGTPPAVAADDVVVYQGSKRDTVTGLVPLQGDRAGLQLFILIDETSRDSLGLHFTSIKNFIAQQPVTTQIGVGYMRNGMVAIVQPLTTDHALAENSVRLPLGATVGYTSPYIALMDLMKKWPVTQDRREVVMITSGIDPYGGGFSNNPFENPYLEEAYNNAQRGGFIVYIIYMPGAGPAGRGFFRTNLAQTGLDMLAQKTGGQSYNLLHGNPVDISPYLRDISFSLNHQYQLTFLAPGAAKPRLEPVKVKTEISNTVLMTAENAYVTSGM